MNPQELAVSDTQSRLEQFRKMATDDPNNELGHFSLGRALLDAGMHDEAITSFARTIELNPNISKAYQLMAQAQLKAERKDEAIKTLTKGAEVANARGRRAHPMQALQPRDAEDGLTAVSKRAGKTHSGKHLRRVLARMDSHRHEGHQRAALAVERSAGFEDLRPAYARVFELARLTWRFAGWVVGCASPSSSSHPPPSAL
jgi:tetratricopeptide (TPR) repeat protein